jgi:hypothetical protein
VVRGSTSRRAKLQGAIRFKTMKGQGNISSRWLKAIRFPSSPMTPHWIAYFSDRRPNSASTKGPKKRPQYSEPTEKDSKEGRNVAASHTGFPSGHLTNEGTWVLFHHDSSAAPQTVQTASPVCGTKNFVSVRLYSAPQLHRTIVAIYVICAANRAFSRAVSLSAPIRVPALFPDARPTAIDSERPSLCSAVGKLGHTPVRHVLQTCELVR